MSSKSNPKADEFYGKPGKWQAEMLKLREIIFDCDLVEDFKWKHPCYTYNDGNVVLVHGFKEYCALLFMKGAIVPDPQGILYQQTENVQSGRQIRFTNLSEIEAQESILKDYIRAAIKVEKAGLKVPQKTTQEYRMPEELENKLAEDPAFYEAFEALTPGRQRGYILFFSAPKQSKTRQARIEKYTDKILDGLGLND